MPETWPQIAPDFAGQSYASVAHTILSAFAGDSFTAEELKADIDAAYAGFDAPEIAPLSEIGANTWLLELFHGPTLAFKDVALQVLGRLFARALAARGGRAAVIVATSGDTGSAAIAALGGLPNIDVFVLHPHGRVSEVQRRQMTTSPHGNVHNIAIEGTFDDAQAIVKALFADDAFARSAHLTAVNSINFARIAAQTVYYFTAAAKLGAAPIFVVPTGNFGDIFAGEAAARMGLPISKLVIATNANDIMSRALNDGVYSTGTVHATLSPSMDIQVASNFERSLYEASGRDTAWIRNAMIVFAREKKLVLQPKILATLRARYAAYACDDLETLKTAAIFYGETGRLIDPHTAVALNAARKMGKQASPIVVLSTAHPAKFPDAVARATGKTPPLPARLQGLYEGLERVNILPNDQAAVKAFIQDRLRTP